MGKVTSESVHIPALPPLGPLEVNQVHWHVLEETWSGEQWAALYSSFHFIVE